LWYDGTINTNTPTSYDLDGDSATVDAAMRATWWDQYEDYGTRAGFCYSLIGGGNRMSTDDPLGQGFPAVVTGYNQDWDFGAGTNGNRTPLPANNGTWPNPIKFDIIGANVIAAGNAISTRFYYQYGGSSNLTAQIYLDKDFNPYNSNSIMVAQLQPTVTGISNVYFYANLGLPTTNVSPGVYSIYARITDGTHPRYLYTPELVQVVASTQPPLLDITSLSKFKVRIGVNGVTGQTITLESSPDLKNWVPFMTNTLTASRWTYTNNVAINSIAQFYRGVVP
jgi:hypothetical protein